MSDRARRGSPATAEPRTRSAVADFEERLRDRMPELTPKRRRLAQIMLTDPAGLMLRTVESLAQEAGVDGATVVRLCNELEYDGFGELKAALRNEYVGFSTAAEKVSRTLVAGRTDLAASSRVFSVDRANIDLAAEWNTDDDIERLARSISTSRRTVIVSAGLSRHVGSLMSHLLRLAGVDAVSPVAEVDAAVEIARLGPEDIAIGISFWRYIVSSERLLARAAAVGAKTAAISDSVNSDTARAVQQVLRVPTDAGELSNSVTAAVSLVNAIVTAVIHCDPERSLAALRCIDDTFDSISII
jgi:DNA-binding MurR/RpiR family transcriptional regulator